MPKYIVYYQTVASSSVQVEAEDEMEAFDKATEEFAYPSICSQCSGWGQKWYVDMGDWEPSDPPYDIELVEE